MVHITAGIAALIFIMVGPRKETSPPHNLAMTVIGTCMLWVGWFDSMVVVVSRPMVLELCLLCHHIWAATAALTWMLIDDYHKEANDFRYLYWCYCWSCCHYTSIRSLRAGRSVNYWFRIWCNLLVLLNVIKNARMAMIL